MDFGLQLGQGTRLETTLSPTLLQSVKILQKTSQELETAIKEEVESNPLLEVDEDYADESEVAIDRDPAEDDPRNAESEMEIPEDIQMMSQGSLDDSAQVESGILDGASSAEIDWDRYLDDGTSYDDALFKEPKLSNRDPDEDWERPIKDVGKSLQEQLEDQLRLWNGTRELHEQLLQAGVTEERFRELVRYLINSVDDDGFLRMGEGPALVSESGDLLIDEIEAMLRGELELENVSMPVREALHVLQSFKPAGIGARNQRECFLIQAYAIEGFSELAIRILEEEYDDLLELRYAKISKALNVGVDEVKAAISSLSRLRPHPGFQLSNGGAHIVNADMRVVEKKGKFEVVCFKSKLQKSLRINETYKAILKDASASKEDKEYVRTHLAKAQDFMKAVGNRYSTMELVMQAIVKRQKEFFVNGPAFLKPMILQDIADDVERDVSTVNRVTNGKYVETPYGIYELKRFFTTGVRQGPAAGDEEVGSAQILDAIKKLVDEEDKSKPLSDQAICNELLKMGIKVARRTVAKYREKELRILPANQRKR